ncbi:MAG TPA: sugar kinase [Anaerolineales bacterium]|nr:sugar kinase [Anaerolineales bacterium]
MPDVITFGEAMLRLAPPDFERLEQASTLKVSVGGSELTVAAGVARLGLETGWVSRLPDNALGRMAQNKAREFGVDTRHVVWTQGDRMGIYFVEYGASPRASGVLYDRGYSAISRIQPDEVDWAKVFEGARWFHTSGITPALSDDAAAVTEVALRAAKGAGLTVSYDLNYRAKLWTPDKARVVQEPFMEFVDVLITTEEDTERVFGIKGADYKEVAKELAERFDFRVVTVTLRGTPSVWRNLWSAFAYAEGRYVEDVSYEIEVVDRLGGGDNYSAGFIYGYLTEGVDKAVRLGNAFSALKQTSWTDFNWTTREEAEKLLQAPLTTSLRITR